MTEKTEERKRLPRRERERLRQRKEILAAALELFSQKGFHNVSMHEIAERAEFAIGTLYKFFRNKEDLYKALMMEKAREYHRLFSAVIERERDVLAAVRGFIRAKARIFSKGLAELRLYFAETRGASFNIKAGLDREILELYDEFMSKLAALFERGVREKVFRDIGSREMAAALDGITNAFLFRFMEDPERHSLEAAVPVIEEIFFRGVLNDEGALERERRNKPGKENRR